MAACLDTVVCILVGDILPGLNTRKTKVVTCMHEVFAAREPLQHAEGICLVFGLLQYQPVDLHHSISANDDCAAGISLLSCNCLRLSCDAYILYAQRVVVTSQG